MSAPSSRWPSRRPRLAEGRVPARSSATARRSSRGTPPLQQAQVAAALTQGRINAAVAQVLAYQAVEQANRMQQAEVDRLERLAEWRDARLRTNAMYEELRAAAFQNRDKLREGLPEVFAGGAGRKAALEHEAKIRDLHAKIGELTVERDFLRRGLKR